MPDNLKPVLTPPIDPQTTKVLVDFMQSVMGLTFDGSSETLFVGVLNKFIKDGFTQMSIQAPNGVRNLSGIGLFLGGGKGSGTGNGGDVIIFAGLPDFANGGVGKGGDVQLAASASSNNANGGQASIDAGDGYINGVGNGEGGSVFIRVGDSIASGKHFGDIVLSSQGHTDTDRAGGFVFIPTSTGTPTGTPSSSPPREGVPMVYDTNNNKFYIYNGGWKSVTLS